MICRPPVFSFNTYQTAHILGAIDVVQEADFSDSCNKSAAAAVSIYEENA
jgi:hypothetical protein